MYTNTDWAARWSGGVPELYEDQRVRLVCHSSRGRGLSYHHYYCRCFISCTIIIVIWWFRSRSGSPETGQATTLGRTDEATTLGTSERSTPTWWAIAWVIIYFVLHSYFHISPCWHHNHQANAEILSGSWSSKHELRSVGKECPAANGWHCCYCCWEGVV